MKVSIFGLGYVGAITTACLARDGFFVIGVDINPDKVFMISRGQAPVMELGLSELLKKGVKSNRIKATTSAMAAVLTSDVSLITVGTPSDSKGRLDLSRVYKVCEEIGAGVARKGKPHIVIIRSTILPGTTKQCGEILHKFSNGLKMHVAFNPEFLREGTAINDYDSPPYTIIGTTDTLAERALRKIYCTISTPIIITEPEIAEMIKLVSNAWHATKITFANEIGRLAKALCVDARLAMDIIVQDKKLNISSAYMRPGFGYGGSCLPKDVRTLTYYGKIENISLPLLSSLEPSNMVQINLALHQVLSTSKRRVGLLGLAFKPATDDLRESPAVELAERLLGKGCDLRILDPAVHQAKLIGANREYIEKKIPHLTNLLVTSASELLEHAEVLVVAHNLVEFRDVLELISPDVPIIDLSGIYQSPPEGKLYEGIAW